MAEEAFKEKKSNTESKGNSGDSIQVIYILSILKKYSSPKNPLSSQDVMDYLEEYYPKGRFEKSESLRKKIRRYLDTLHESYSNGCVRKIEGNTRIGHKWYYDVSRDRFKDGEGVAHETLTETEVGLLVDLISSTKIFNSEGTRGLIDKLLMKTSISYEDRSRRLDAIQKEAWHKSSNSDLAEKKGLIEDCFFVSNITFDYENEEDITATPLKWSYEDGICYLLANVKGEQRKFSLDKIRICYAVEDEYEIPEDFGRYDKETDSDKTALDSLFVNIPVINSAIADKKILNFLYRSYVVDNNKVVSREEAKRALPHSLVFNDGKYYMIGIDENAKGTNKIVYSRVDLMFELYCTEPKTKLSDWDKHIFDTIERARIVEKHPLMMTGTEVPITFKVIESALGRVIDAFAITTDKFKVTDETRTVDDSSEEGSHEERVVKVQVRTTSEEAFRWALANADAVEVEITSQEIRNRLARIAEPIYQLYTKGISDKVRENLDYVLKERTFKITYKVDKNTAYETYKELARRGKLGVVDNMGIGLHGEGDFYNLDYFGEFFNTERLILKGPEIKELAWISKLTKLEILKVEESELEDASWLKDLKKLRWLFLRESSFSDLSVLKGHKEIDILDISGTNVSDISFIEKFPKLTQLCIAMCPIEDYSPLFTTQSSIKYLEIDRRALEKIGEEKIRSRHIGIDIKVTNNTPFWNIF